MDDSDADDEQPERVDGQPEHVDQQLEHVDEQLDADLGAREYDDLVAALANRAAAAPADTSRSDAVWDAVGDVVPHLQPAVCERILALADSDPDAMLVAQVTEERGSGDAERERAQALTALVGDVLARLEEREHRADDAGDPGASEGSGDAGASDRSDDAGASGSTDETTGR